MLKAKTTILLFSLLFTLSTIASCAGSSGTPDNTTGIADGETVPDDTTAADSTPEAIYPYTFTDSTGAEIVLDAEPVTVAVLFSSYADIWVSAGGTVDITVGEAVERGFADARAVLVDEGAGHTAIDLETLVAAEPDLVIATSEYDCQKEAVELCRGAGIPAAAFQVDNFDDYLSMLKIFCDITENPDAYIKYGTDVKDKIDTLREQVAAGLDSGAIEAPSILFVRAGSSAKSTKAKTTADHFVCAMLSELGAVNIADGNGELTGSLSLEAIVEGNPDYLFITTMGDEDAAKSYMNSVLESEGWRELDCVKDSHYDYLSKELFHFKPNAKWADAYAYLVSVLYPGLAID